MNLSKNYKKITLKVSKKNILTVESISATAINLLFGLILTAKTASSNSNVLVCNKDNTWKYFCIY